MIVYSLLFITLALATVSLLLVWRCRRKQLSECWHTGLLATSLACFIYLFGAWVFLSVYVKYVFAVMFSLVAFAAGLSRNNGVPEKRKSSRAISLIISGIFTTLCILYYTGTTGKPYGVANLSFPFKRGTYFVFQGGKGLPTNVFHFALRGAVFAMDLIKLNGAGNRANHIFSQRLEDYETFGDTIYSPCNGRVMRTAAENPDNIPPNRKRGPSNTNQVLVASPAFYVFLV